MMINSSLEPPLCDEPDGNPEPLVNRLPRGSCDTHAHVFCSHKAYPLTPERNYTPAKADHLMYRELLRRIGFERAVLIQPSVYGTDNRCMEEALALLQHDDEFEWRGVAVQDDAVSDEQLEALHNVGVRGVRMNALFRGGVDFSTAEQLATRIAGLGWHLQLLLDVSEFEGLAERVDRLPVDCVIDHMGHMASRKGVQVAGFQELLTLMRGGRTWVKLSGTNRITTSHHPPYDDVEPFLGALVEARPDRCLFGTDWPHVQLPGPMPNDGALVNEFLRLVPSAEVRQSILVDNPAQLYGFSPS